MNATITSICSTCWPGKEPSLGDPDECEYFQVEHELCTSVVATSRSRTPRDCDKFLAVGSPDKDCQTRKTNARRRALAGCYAPAGRVHAVAKPGIKYGHRLGRIFLIPH